MSRFTVSAKVSNRAHAKMVEQLDEGSKIRSLTGRVARRGMMQMFFELEDCKITPAW